MTTATATNGPRPLNERNFSLSEVCVLMLLEMYSLDNREARKAWMETGAPGEVFDRIHDRLVGEGTLIAHPRRSNITQTNNIFIGLREHYNSILLRAALELEGS